METVQTFLAANLKTILFIALAVVSVWFVGAWIEVTRKKAWTTYHSLVGFVMCFFDTLGIGNFATTTSAFKFRSSIPDEQIPGTLNVGYALPTVVQAFIYISIVQVDVLTLALMIAASVAGAWLGAGVVSGWPRHHIRIGMGFCLFGAAGLMLLSQLKLVPGGGEALQLQGLKLVLGLGGNFALGALMALGIGLYAPCLILVSLLGMDPRAAFPIMMGSCAFLMPIGGMRFIQRGSYNLTTSIVLTFSGIPAVLIAAYVVRQLTLTQVRWLVVGVVLYTATMMLRSAFTEKQPAPIRRTDSAVAD